MTQLEERIIDEPVLEIGYADSLVRRITTGDVDAQRELTELIRRDMARSDADIKAASGSPLPFPPLAEREQDVTARFTVSVHTYGRPEQVQREVARVLKRVTGLEFRNVEVAPWGG